MPLTNKIVQPQSMDVQRIIYTCYLCISFCWTEIVLWSGIKKGPPRKLKFPDPAEVVSALKEVLKSK